MKRKLLLMLATGFCLNASAQTEPQITEWIFNTTGATGSYDNGTTIVNLTDQADILSVDYTSTTVYITCEGLSSDQMGPWTIPNSSVAGQDKIYEIPLNPVEETGAKTSVPEGGEIGIATNGVAIFGFESAESYSNANDDVRFSGDEIWNADAWVTEQTTMDGNGAHPAGDQYHYHATPENLWDGSTTTHSPIIGWALDGFPIYGPYGYSSAMNASSGIKRIESGYSKRSITQRHRLPGETSDLPSGQWGPDVTTNGRFDLGTFVEDYEYTGVGDLDEYNGRTCVTPEFPGGTYAYFTTVDAQGDPAHPYILAYEYYGELSPMKLGSKGNATIDVNAVNYDPTVTSVDPALAFDVMVYPNPASDQVSISTTPDQVQIVNQQGNVVYSGNETAIDIRNLDAGIYHVVVTSGQQQVTKQIVVN